jgi:hypothetical protein
MTSLVPEIAKTRKQIEGALDEFAKKLPPNLVYQSYYALQEQLGRKLTRNELKRFNRLMPVRKFRFSFRDIVRAVNRDYASETLLKTILTDANHRHMLDTGDLLSIVEFVIAFRARYDKLKPVWNKHDPKADSHMKRRMNLPFWWQKDYKEKKLEFTHNIFSSRILNDTLRESMKKYKRTKRCVDVKNDLTKARREMGWDALPTNVQDVIINYVLHNKLPDSDLVES